MSFRFGSDDVHVSITKESIKEVKEYDEKTEFHELDMSFLILNGDISKTRELIKIIDSTITDFNNSQQKDDDSYNPTKNDFSKILGILEKGNLNKETSVSRRCKDGFKQLEVKIRMDYP